MTDRAAHLLDEVLKLPLEERVKIADALYASLDGPEPGPEEQAEIDAAWEAEIRRRVERVAAGERGIPAEEAMARLRAGLRGQQKA